MYHIDFFFLIPWNVASVRQSPVDGPVRTISRCTTSCWRQTAWSLPQIVLQPSLPQPLPPAATAAANPVSSFTCEAVLPQTGNWPVTSFCLISTNGLIKVALGQACQECRCCLISAKIKFPARIGIIWSCFWGESELGFSQTGFLGGFAPQTDSSTFICPLYSNNSFLLHWNFWFDWRWQLI